METRSNRKGKKMERNLSLATLVLLCLVAVISWPALNAEEAKPAATELKDADTVVTISKLLDRIESLEQRIAVLETHDSAVRLVDSRDEVDVNTLPHVVPKAANEDAQPVPLAPQGPLYLLPYNPATAADGAQDDEAQHTNGKKWRFHLLKHRPTAATSNNSNKIY